MNLTLNLKLDSRPLHFGLTEVKPHFNFVVEESDIQLFSSLPNDSQPVFLSRTENETLVLAIKQLLSRTLSTSIFFVIDITPTALNAELLEDNILLAHDQIEINDILERYNFCVRILSQLRCDYLSTQDNTLCIQISTRDPINAQVLLLLTDSLKSLGFKLEI
jgi:hypothetical protein